MKTIHQHGVMLTLFDTGVLLKGAPGIGKSELALALLARGHRLVADDVVEYHSIDKQLVIGQAPRLLQRYLMVRGFGVMNVCEHFGEQAYCPQHPLHLVIDLDGNSKAPEMPALGSEHTVELLLGQPIPKVSLPLEKHPHMTVLCESAVRAYQLREKGIDSTHIFIEQQKAALHTTARSES